MKRNYTTKNILYVSSDSIILSVLDKVDDKYVCLYNETAENKAENFGSIINGLLTDCSNNLQTFVSSIDLVIDNALIASSKELEKNNFVSNVLSGLNKLNINVLSNNNYKDLINDENLSEQLILEINNNQIQLNNYHNGKLIKTERFAEAIKFIKTQLADRYQANESDITKLIELANKIESNPSNPINVCCKINKRFKEIEYISLNDFINEYELVLSEVINEIVEKSCKNSNSRIYVLASQNELLINSLKYQNWKVIKPKANIIGLSENVCTKQLNSLLGAYERICFAETKNVSVDNGMVNSELETQELATN